MQADPVAQSQILHTVLTDPNVLCWKRKVLSPAESEAMRWRSRRAVGCVCLAALSAAASVLAAGADRPLSWAAALGVVLALGGYVVLVLRGARLSSFEIRPADSGWRVSYAYRGILLKVTRERAFSSRGAAESFLQN